MKKKKLSTVPSGNLSSLVGVGGLGIMQNNANLNDIYDNIFIMFHRNMDDSPIMVKPYKWTSYQSSGEIADGVVVVHSGKVLVVAPTQPSLYWSSAAINGGGYVALDRIIAMNDWSGKNNTTAQIAASSENAVTNTNSYAPGFCNLYSRKNANGKGLKEGKWWLPSLGELIMIYANMRKINYALGFITGSNPLQEGSYWSSTEYSVTHAWHMNLGIGMIFPYTKATFQLNIRPVSEFIF